MGPFDNRKDRDYQTKFDMKKKPKKMNPVLKVLAWILSFPAFFFQKQTLIKKNMKGLKAPYLILCNHSAFMDFKVVTKATFPHSSCNIVAIDGFIHREGLLRAVGCMCKRKFTNDRILIRHIQYALHELKQIVVLYPEARYTLVGTNAILPESLGKLIQLLKVPVVMLRMSGHYLDSPVWNLVHRKNRLEATMEQILTLEDVLKKETSEINDIVNNAFVYDEYRFQKENNIKITYPKRAEGLHKVLYQCPSCHTEHQMISYDHILSCKACKKTYEMSELGELNSTSGTTEFSHIPDWYEWERSQVKEQILTGTYRIEDEVLVDSLPNSKGFIPFGTGHLLHDETGFTLTFTVDGTKEILKKEVTSMYSCHIEYNYNNKGDCIDLSTLDDTYYIYFQHLENVVTKIHFATEELYKIAKEKQVLPVKNPENVVKSRESVS